ncbi:MAG: hypothetical protein ABIF88_03395 [archaeon]
MKNSLIKKGFASIALVGFLGACTSTGSNKLFSVVGPLAGIGAMGQTLDSEKDKPEEGLHQYFEAGPVYRHALVQNVRDVPEEIRDVPIHSDDGYASGKGGPIPSDDINVGPRTGGFFRYGGRMPVIKDTLFAKLGIEVELGGIFTSDKPSRNYTNAVGTSQRGRGAALTYYSIHTKSGPNWNSSLIPKIVGGLELELSDSVTVGANYSIWREDLVAETGYDRYDSLEHRSSFNLVDMTVSSITGSLKFSGDKNCYFFVEGGVQRVLSKRYYDLGREADIDFNENPFMVMIGARINF